jgi:hypothetical protein
MSEKLRAPSLETATARLRLTKGKFHRHRLGPGGAVLYRRYGDVAGHFYSCVGIGNATGKDKVERIGLAADREPGDGVRVFELNQASCLSTILTAAHTQLTSRLMVVRSRGLLPHLVAFVVRLLCQRTRSFLLIEVCAHRDMQDGLRRYYGCCSEREIKCPASG